MFLSPELFLDCLILIINDSSSRTYKTVLELVKLFENESKANTTIDNEITHFYIRLIKQIIEQKITKDSKDELRMILLKFKSDRVLTNRKDVFDLLMATFLSDDQMNVERLEKVADRIQNTILWYRASKGMRSGYAALNRAADAADTTTQKSELKSVLDHVKSIAEVYDNNNVFDGNKPAEHVDFSDKESIRAAIKKHRERTIGGILRLGLQGLNKMLGSRGGLIRGESIVFYALPHHYKSGILVSIGKWIARYNAPPTDEAGRKALIILFSLENEAFQNTIWLFRHTYETTTGKSARGMKEEDVIEYMYHYFNEMGYTFIIERHQPSDFGFREYVERINYYENAGYNIVASIVDYLNLCKKGGLNPEQNKGTEMGNHLRIRELFSLMCNYNKAKGIVFPTAHPLNRKAMEIVATGVTNPVKRFSTDHIADSVDVSREVDCEVYMHKELNQANEPYLTFKRGKHRYVDDTPIVDMYFAYRFSAQGLPDDILTEPKFVRDIYADNTAINGTPPPGDYPAQEIF